MATHWSKTNSRAAANIFQTPYLLPGYSLGELAGVDAEVERLRTNSRGTAREKETSRGGCYIRAQ